MLHWTRWVCDMVCFFSCYSKSKIWVKKAGDRWGFQTHGWLGCSAHVSPCCCLRYQAGGPKSKAHPYFSPNASHNNCVEDAVKYKASLDSQTLFRNLVRWWITGVAGRGSWFLTLLDLFSGILQMNKCPEPSAAPPSLEPPFPHPNPQTGPLTYIAVPGFQWFSPSLVEF